MALDNAMATRTKLHSARLCVKVVDLNHLLEKVELISKLGKKHRKLFLKIFQTLGMPIKNRVIWLKIVPIKVRIIQALKRK